jgi:hypothetical protein
MRLPDVFEGLRRPMTDAVQNGIRTLPHRNRFSNKHRCAVQGLIRIFMKIFQLRCVPVAVLQYGFMARRLADAATPTREGSGVESLCDADNPADGLI